jgi:cation transport ATPase
MSEGTAILHETARRLRLALPDSVDAGQVEGTLQRIAGVTGTRVNRRAGCIVVAHDGRAGVRAEVLAGLGGVHGAQAGPAPDEGAAPRAARPGGQRKRGPGGGPGAAPRSAGSGRAVAAGPRDAAALWRWSPAALALATPLLPPPWRTGAALSTVALRALVQRRSLARDPAAAVLDAAGLATLALSRQAGVVSAAVLLRHLAELLSSRLSEQADDVLRHLLPDEADRYLALREPPPRRGPRSAANGGAAGALAGELAGGQWWPLRQLRAGDRLRLFPGDVVPVDGCVVDGEGTIAAVLPGSPARRVAAGAALSAGERVARGTLELRAEADPAHSRLARLREQLRHVLAARDAGAPGAGGERRLAALPLTAAMLVWAFTGDGARAAAMLQADPRQGVELARPLAREATLLALARHGLVSAGLDAALRLAAARTLALQDSGVLASGRWTVRELRTAPGTGAAQVRRWLARWAAPTAEPGAADAMTSFPDRLVREWQRHGATLRAGTREVHLAAPPRLREVFGLDWPAWAQQPAHDTGTSRARATGATRGGASTSHSGARDGSGTPGSGGAAGTTGPTLPGPGSRPLGDALVRRFACVSGSRVVACVTLASPWRDGLDAHLQALCETGFERVAVFAEAPQDHAGLHEPLLTGAHVEARNDVEGEAEDTASPPQVHWPAGGAPAYADWLAAATHEGDPAVVVHTVLRDVVPPGSLGLAPLEAESGPHGVLVGDPLASLLAARRAAQAIARRLQRREGLAVAADAALMGASAVRLLPPLATTLLHQAVALLLLLDGALIARLGTGAAAAPPHKENER